jgi:5-methylcytosine-specific restriction enzyme A
MAWEGSTRGERLPPNWHQIRRVVLAEEPWCRWCGAPSNQVDHIIAGDDHRRANLQALCERCHAIKSAREGNAAAIARGRPTSKRTPERHPGLV